MALREPPWWYGEDPYRMRDWLAPIARAYGSIAKARYTRHTGYRSSLPVVCVGNLTAGGSGKTPLAIALARRLISLGNSIAFLTRGYGGATAGPEWLDPAVPHSAERYGDEPLMLAATARVMVCADREQGAKAIEATPPAADVIIMDDGLQNPALQKDLSLAVVDAVRGIGNGGVIPSGPLRAPLDFQLGLADALIVSRTGPDAPVGSVHSLLRREFPGPVLTAHISPDGDMSWLAGRPFVAFAGIAGPDRFFDLLERLGATILERRRFADHHSLTAREARALLERARARGAGLITTEKDFVRLGAMDGPIAELRNQAAVLRIETRFDQPDAGRLDALIASAIGPRLRSRTS